MWEGDRVGPMMTTEAATTTTSRAPITRFLLVAILLLSRVLVVDASNRHHGGGEDEEEVARVTRQFSPGTSGVGEVISVDAAEFEKLSEGRTTPSENATERDDVGVSDVVLVPPSDGEISKRVGVMEEGEEEEDMERGDDAAVDSESSERASDELRDKQRPAVFQDENRRKVVVGQPPEHGEQDLSFTGILNGLLDTFINAPDPAPHQPQRPYRPQPPEQPRPGGGGSPQTSTSQPSIEDDEADEEESDALLLKDQLSTPSTTAEELSNEDDNISAGLLEEEEDNLSQDVGDSPESTRANGTEPQPTPSPSKPCGGECRNIIFGLFLCDEIDNDAFCSEPGLACCVNNEPELPYVRYKPYSNSSEESPEVHLDNEHDVLQTTDSEEEDDLNQNNQGSPQSRPTSSPPQMPPPHRYPPQFTQNRHPYNPQPHYYYPQNTPAAPVHPPPRMPLPCPRYCVKNVLDSYCSERLPAQFGCGVDGFCCAHDVAVTQDTRGEQDNNEEEEEENVESINSVRNENVDGDDDSANTTNKVLGPCTEDVGSCVSRNIINIICFGHATPTDFYTCPRSNMKCCSRKTAIPRESLPSTTPLPQKLDTNVITRNTSSYVPPKQHQQQQGQVPAQFSPGQHIYNNPPPAFLHPTPPAPPPLAETPPPPLHHSIPGTQFTSPFSSNALTPPTRNTNARQPIGSYVCGVKGVPTVAKRRRRKRVVGGSDSLPGEWCWQVALINSLNQYLCGGALIGTQWVLTAAHCVTNIVRSGDAIYVRVGDHDLTSRYGSPGAQTLRVATTYIHHNHNSQTLDNDIALLKLQGNAALKEGVCLVCLPSRNHMSEIPGKRCTVTGYGYMGESGPIPLRIREATLPIVSEDECVRKVNAVTEKVFALPMSSFCAGGELRNDACQGDGGGPLVCRADDPHTGDPGTGYFELTGLVSWGFGCGRENVPGVYVKVSSFIGWIHQIIRSN